MEHFTKFLGAAVVAASPVAAWAQQLPEPNVPDYWCGHPMMGWGSGWGGMAFGPFFIIIVLALVIALAVVLVLVRWVVEPRSGARSSGARPPVDILRERFARGEIDKDEFEERRRLLGE